MVSYSSKFVMQNDPCLEEPNVLTLDCYSLQPAPFIAEDRREEKMFRYRDKRVCWLKKNIGIDLFMFKLYLEFSFQDLYVDRPLPYLIGSQLFMETDDVGLGDLSSEGSVYPGC